MKLWKELAIGLLTVLVTAVGWVLADTLNTLKDVPTTSEVRTMIEKEAPGVTASIRLEQTADDMEEVKVEFKEYKKEQSQEWKEYRVKQDTLLKQQTENNLMLKLILEKLDK